MQVPDGTDITRYLQVAAQFTVLPLSVLRWDSPLS